MRQQQFSTQTISPALILLTNVPQVLNLGFDPEDIDHAVGRTHAANRSDEIFKDPSGEPLRLGGAGIGYAPPALQGRNMSTVDKRTGPGYHSHCIQLFSWDAGNLGRSSKRDTLSDLVASQFHSMCLQEAYHVSVQPFLFSSRDISGCESRGRCTRINAGGTGIKVVRKCHSEKAPHCDFADRT